MKKGEATMTIHYTPRGVCSRAMEIDVEDGVIQAVRRMEGIRCGGKPTSCPDQLAQALKQAM